MEKVAAMNIYHQDNNNNNNNKNRNGGWSIVRT